MFYNNIYTRARFIFLMVLIIFMLIILKVFYIEVISYNKLNTLANDLWSRNLPISADRGNIYDRNGKVIATNITTTSLVFIPNQIVDKEEVSKKISNILNVNYEDIYKHAIKNVSIEKVNPEGRRLSYDIAEKIDLELNLSYNNDWSVFS